MGVFQEGFLRLEEMGVLDVIVPFILVFTIVFAVLQKTKILGTTKVGDVDQPRKNFNSMIALVMGLAVVIPHVTGTYPPDGDIVYIINHALPNVSAILVAIIMLLLIIGVFGSGVEIGKTPLAGWAVVFAIAATVFIFGSAANWFEMPYWLDFLRDRDTQSLIIVVLVFALIIYFVTKEDKAKDPTKYSFAENLGKVMGYKREP